MVFDTCGKQGSPSDLLRVWILTLVGGETTLSFVILCVHKKAISSLLNLSWLQNCFGLKAGIWQALP